MPGLGTIANAVAIIIGGLIGVLAKNYLKERFRQIVICALGLCVVAIGLSGMLSQMIVIENDVISTKGTYVLIFSFVLGSITGELLNLDHGLERFGTYLKSKLDKSGDSTFIDGFVTSSLTVCIGAMAIIGSINDGLHADHSILFTKAILDMIFVMLMAASKGKGCIFSAIPVAILQGSVTALSFLIAPILTETSIQNLSMTGSLLIACVGVNLICDGKFRIKVANMLPTIIFAVVAAYIPFLNQ